jgi:glycosyltransferase involved in cell wall biosynthesis
MSTVTAVVTCMTDAEQPFVGAAVQSVAAQTVDCRIRLYVSQANDWIDAIISDVPGVVVRRILMQDAGPVRNIGARESETEWVAFLDGDDIWMKNKLQRQFGVATQGVDLMGADHMLIDEEGQACAYAMAQFIPMTSSWLVRRETIIRMPFEGGLSQDGRWWRRYARQTRRVRLPEVLIGYRVRWVSASSASPSKKRKVAIVKIASMPGVRPIVLAATWIGHMATRRREYIWAPEWGVEPN